MDMPNFDFTISEKEMIKEVKHVKEELSKGRPVEELVFEYKNKYSIQEAFLIIMQAKMQNMIDPQFHNFSGRHN